MDLIILRFNLPVRDGRGGRDEEDQNELHFLRQSHLWMLYVCETVSFLKAGEDGKPRNNFPIYCSTFTRSHQEEQVFFFFRELNIETLFFAWKKQK